MKTIEQVVEYLDKKMKKVDEEFNNTPEDFPYRRASLCFFYLVNSKTL